MRIQLTTHDPSLFRELETAAEGSSSDLPANILIGAPTREPRETHVLSAPDIISFGATVGSAVAIKLFASWLYDKIRERTSQLRINDEVVTISVVEIRRVVEHVVRTSEQHRPRE